MRLTVEIEFDGAAFCDPMTGEHTGESIVPELSRIMHELAERLLYQVPHPGANIRDRNGNTCGRTWVTRTNVRRRPATWEG